MRNQELGGKRAEDEGEKESKRKEFTLREKNVV